jgi:hypothetical protein
MKALYSLLLLVALAPFGCSGSGSSGGDACVETLALCENGGAATCVGAYARRCAEDGLAFEYDYCFGAVCRSGACANPACMDPGKRACKDTYNVQVCAEDLSTLTTEACPADTKCVGGACVDDNCQAGDVACGWATLLECVGSGSWSSAACAGGGPCDPKTKTCLQAHPFCRENPLGRRCDSPSTALVCAPGAFATYEDCAGDEVCVEGLCQQRICGVPYYPDTTGGGDDTGTDPKDVFNPDLSMDAINLDFGSGADLPDQHEFPEGNMTINGGDFVNEEVAFESNSAANYYPAKKTLQVKLTKGIYQVVVMFENIADGKPGSFTSSVPSAVRVKIRFNDGTSLPGELQWKYEAKTYLVVLQEFGGKNGWVAGTFTCVMEDLTGGPAIELSNGYFAVPRKE